MNLLSMIIKADYDRKSRFHDLKGNIPELINWVYMPFALSTTCLRHLFGYRPSKPWISYRAIRQFDQLIQPTWQLLEFGSGMSTLWFAQRCKHIVSIESNPEWEKTVSSLIVAKRLENKATVVLRSTDTYCDLTEFQGGMFDFILVDGLHRRECVEKVIAKIKTNGFLYLDNVDAIENRGAELFLINAASGTCQ